MDMGQQEFLDLILGLYDDGYEQAAPPGADIDREITEAAHCEDCGGPLQFRPFKKTNSYRAFAVCTNGCGAYEF